jgi:hypothetical protein
MKVFISSTYEDLHVHRAAVNEMLQRMAVRFSAMEFFGSRADETVEACKKEISQCDVLIGIYAWRYGWQSAKGRPSITEEEFDYARRLGKRCLCYVVDPEHPWPPKYIDSGESAERLASLKAKIDRLVRSKFTTAENLAMQVAADLAREMPTNLAGNSFGGLLRVNWEVFSPEMQGVLATAYSQARSDAADGVVATRHVVAALAHLPNTALPLIIGFPQVELPRYLPNLPTPDVAELFNYGRPVSHCVLGSMERLLPLHSAAQRLLAIELAVDLLKHGSGDSVASFRNAGVDEMAVDTMMQWIRSTATNKSLLRQALRELTDAEVVHLAYLSDIDISEQLDGSALRADVLARCFSNHKTFILVGELIRRHPRLLMPSENQSPRRKVATKSR